MILKSSVEGGFNTKLNYQLIDNYGAFRTATEKTKKMHGYLYLTSKPGLVTTLFSVLSHGLPVQCAKGAQ